MGGPFGPLPLPCPKGASHTKGQAGRPLPEEAHTHDNTDSMRCLGPCQPCSAQLQQACPMHTGPKRPCGSTYIHAMPPGPHPAPPRPGPDPRSAMQDTPALRAQAPFHRRIPRSQAPRGLVRSRRRPAARPQLLEGHRGRRRCHAARSRQRHRQLPHGRRDEADLLELGRVLWVPPSSRQRQRQMAPSVLLGLHRRRASWRAGMG